MPKLPMGDISAAAIIYRYGESDEIILTPVRGTVSVRIGAGKSNVEEEGMGDAAVDAVLTGKVIEVDVPLTRIDKDKIALVSLGERVGGKVTIPNQAGCALYERSHAMAVVPLCNNKPSVDPDTYIIFYKAHPYPAIDLAYNRADQRIFLTKFAVFPSQESGQVDEFGNFFLE